MTIKSYWFITVSQLFFVQYTVRFYFKLKKYTLVKRQHKRVAGVVLSFKRDKQIRTGQRKIDVNAMLTRRVKNV